MEEFIKADFHTHSAFSGGADAPEKIVLKALEAGMTGLGFSEHVDPDARISVSDFPAYLAECARLREKYGDRLEILIGAELDGQMPSSAAAGAEYIIGSNHYLNAGDGIDPVPVDLRPEYLTEAAGKYFGGDPYRLIRQYYRQEAELAERMHPDIIGHFDLIARFSEECDLFDTSDGRYRAAALEAMEYLVSKGILFEINCGALNRGLKRELYPDMFLLKRLKEMGGEIIFSSDAHRREHLTGHFGDALQAALSCGFGHVNILTMEGTGKVCFRQIGIR